MTVAQRKTLEKFAVGEEPLNRAIRAALEEIGRLEAERDRRQRDGYRTLVRNLRKAHETEE